MSARAIFRRHPILRWTVPAGALIVVGIVGSGMLSSASIGSSLPARSAGELLAAVENAHVDGLSGTVVEKAALGLPQLPNFGGASADTTSVTDLLSGSHAMRVWFAGPSKQRVALIGTVGETDVFHNATSLWLWNSESQTATHTTLPAGDSDKVPTQISTLTPQQLADQALAAIDPTTKISPDVQRRVADRDAYQLVLTPKASASRIGSVKVAVDGQTKIPLGVQVFARGEPTTPALDVSFTHIDLTVPGDANFNFTPSKNTTVKEQRFGDVPGAQRATDVGKALKVVGTGWTSVLELRDGSLLGLPTPGTRPAGAAAGVASLVVSLLQPVHGTWGSGHLLDSTLLTALVTDDGRVYLGAVDPQVLYDAAAANK